MEEFTNLERFRALIDDADALSTALSTCDDVSQLVHQLDITGCSLLYYAAMKGNAATCALLMAHGASPIQRCGRTRDDAIAKASWQGHLGVMNVILTSERVKMQRDRLGATALHVAAKNGAAAACLRLLALGFTMVRDRMATSPLRLASSRGHSNVCVALVQHGGEPDAFGVGLNVRVHCSRPYSSGDVPVPRSGPAVFRLADSVFVCGGDAIGQPRGVPVLWKVPIDAAVRNLGSTASGVRIRLPDSDTASASEEMAQLTFVDDMALNDVLKIENGDDGAVIENVDPEDRLMGVTIASEPARANMAGNIAYFEVTIEDQGNRGFIAIGWSSSDIPVQKLVGWYDKSVAYHADDGKLYCARPYGRLYGPKFGTGDVVGAGVHLDSRKVFFTRNGDYVGLLDAPSGDYDMHAAIGLYSQGERVRINAVGPFEFDFSTPSLHWEAMIPDPAIELMDVSAVTSKTFSHAYLVGHMGAVVRLDAVDGSVHIADVGRSARLPSVNRHRRYAMDEYDALFSCVDDQRNGVTVWRFSFATGLWEPVPSSEGRPAPKVKVSEASFTALGDGIFALMGGTTDARETMVGEFERREDDDDRAVTVDEAGNEITDDSVDTAFAQRFAWMSVRNGLWLFDARRQGWFGLDDVDIGNERQANGFPHVNLEPLMFVGRRNAAVTMTRITEDACSPLLLSGGWDGESQRNDLVVMRVARLPVFPGTDAPSFAVRAAYLQQTGTVPMPRNQHALIATGDNTLMMFGGWNGNARLNDVDFLRFDWQRPLLAQAFEQRETTGDVIFCLDDGSTVRAHRFVVCRRASVLATLIPAGADEVEVALSKVTHQWLHALLHYCYLDAVLHVGQDAGRWTLPVSPTGDECRAFLAGVVARFAPEHVDRVAELLSSVRGELPSTLADDLRTAFSVVRHGADDAPNGFALGADFDMVLRVDATTSVLAHRVVLGSGSEFFRGALSMSSSETGCVDVSRMGDDELCVVAVVEHIYTNGALDWTDERGSRVTDIMSAACRFGVLSLAAECEQLIIPLVDKDNAEWIHALAASLARQTLTTHCVSVMSRDD